MLLYLAYFPFQAFDYPRCWFWVGMIQREENRGCFLWHFTVKEVHSTTHNVALWRLIWLTSPFLTKEEVMIIYLTFKDQEMIFFVFIIGMLLLVKDCVMKLNKNSQNIKNMNFSDADRERGLLLLWKLDGI